MLGSVEVGDRLTSYTIVDFQKPNLHTSYRFKPIIPLKLTVHDTKTYIVPPAKSSLSIPSQKLQFCSSVVMAKSFGITLDFLLCFSQPVSNPCVYLLCWLSLPSPFRISASLPPSPHHAGPGHQHLCPGVPPPQPPLLPFKNPHPSLQLSDVFKKKVCSCHQSLRII